MRSHRRRRVLAAPFVVTAALAPACGAQEAPPKEPERTSTPPASRTEPERVPTTDPTPDPGTASTPAPAPAGKGAWREDHAGHWIYAYESGDQIWYHDGSCELRQAVDCPEGAICNPPPPQAVACPDGLPDEARK